MFSKTAQPIKIFCFVCLAAVLFCLFIWASAALTVAIVNLAQYAGGPIGTYLTDKGADRVMRRILLAGVVIILILILKKFGWHGWKDCGWSQPETELPSRRWAQLLQGVLLGCISIGSIAALTILTGLHNLKASAENGLQLAGLILTFSVSGILVALIEETIFRGILFRVFARAWNAWTAALVISIVFASAHFVGPGNAAFQGDSFLAITLNLTLATLASFLPPVHALVQFFNLALLGIVLCVFVMRTKTIWMSVGAHAVWVLIIALHSHFTTLNPAAPPSIWLGKRNDFTDSLAAVLAFAALILLARWSGKKNGRPAIIRGQRWNIYHDQDVVMPSATDQLGPGNGALAAGFAEPGLPTEAVSAQAGPGAPPPPSAGQPLKIPDVELQKFLQTGDDFFSAGNILKSYPGCQVVYQDGLVLKKYRPKNFLNSLRFAFRPPRSRRAFLLANALIAHGVPTPPVLAWSAARKLGLLMSEAMIVAGVKNAEQLTDWLKIKTADPAVRLRVMEAYGNLMAAFHCHGYSNRDLKHENVMCARDKPWLLWVVDLDGVRKHLFICRRRAGRDLMRVGKSLASLGWTDKAETGAFFKAYNSQVPARLHRSAFPV